MALSFKCPNCGQHMVVKHLKAGETAQCRRCGVEVGVPETSVEVDTEPDYMLLNGAEAESSDEGRQKAPIVAPHSGSGVPSVEAIATIVYETALRKASLWWAIAGAVFVILAILTPESMSYFLAAPGGLLLALAGLAVLTTHRDLGLLGALGLIAAGALAAVLPVVAVRRLAALTISHNVEKAQLDFIHWAAVVALVYEGIREFKVFWRLRPKVVILNRFRRDEAKRRLAEFTHAKVDPEAGILQLTVESQELLRKKKRRYVVVLLSERALCIKEGLDDFFMIERRGAREWKFEEKGKVKLLQHGGGFRKTTFMEPSLTALKIWAGLPEDWEGKEKRDAWRVPER